MAACPNSIQRAFEEVRRELEETVVKLKESHEPEHRRSLLLNMRLLLKEADEIIATDVPRTPIPALPVDLPAPAYDRQPE